MVTTHRRDRKDRREKPFRERKKSALRPQRSPKANLPSARFSAVKDMLNSYEFCFECKSKGENSQMVALIRFLSDAYVFVIVIRVLLSWIRHNPYHPLIRIVYQITDPPLDLIRRYLPNFGGLDLSPMILIFAIILIEKVIIRILVF